MIDETKERNWLAIEIALAKHEMERLREFYGADYFDKVNRIEGWTPNKQHNNSI